MLKKYAESFYQIGAILATFRAYMSDTPGRAAIAGADDSNEIKKDTAQISAEHAVQILAGRLGEINLAFSLKAVNRLATGLQSGSLKPSEMVDAFTDIDKRIRDELDERVMFFVAPARAAHYDDFRGGWEAALAKFPIAADAEEAEKCFALERWTGCVFHLMRIVEIGVQALGTRLSIPVAVTEPWGTVVREIQDAVKALPRTTPTEKDEQSRFAVIADALFQVNLAWRIPAMHPRTPGVKYTEEDAAEVLPRVKALMRHLAATL